MASFRLSLFFAICCGQIALSHAASAEPLRQALVVAYQSHPALLAERERLAATDEQVPLAKSDFRPRVIARGDAGRNRAELETQSAAGLATSQTQEIISPRGYQIELTQPIFRGLRTVNAIRRAEANVLAAREVLRALEQATLLDAVTAYMNVIRDSDLVRLNENDVRVLSAEVRSLRERFTAGDATRTDVAQAQARRETAVSALDVAKTNLQSSRAVYRQAIGHPPRNLNSPRIHLSRLPKSLSVVVDAALAETPQVVQAAFNELAARHDIDLIRGELLPEVNLEGRYEERFSTSLGTERSENASIVGRLTVPLYQGGAVYARIRAAKRTRVALVREIDRARREARERATTAWAQLRAARLQIQSTTRSVAFTRTALAGVRKEETAGSRTVLDVLDAKQELLMAESNRVIAQRDLVVAYYTVRAAMGRLTAAALNLEVELHDPEEHYNEVVDKAWGTTVTADENYGGYQVANDQIANGVFGVSSER